MRASRKGLQHTSTAIFNSAHLLSTGEIRNIRLEEIQISEDEKLWLVTLGFDRLLEEDESLVPDQTKREYKLFEIDADTRQVKAMKIRIV